MFTSCDVLHETKQKKVNNLSRVRTADWKSSLKPILIKDFLAAGFFPNGNLIRRVLRKGGMTMAE